jgi:DUF438 domain-containing protein
MTAGGGANMSEGQNRETRKNAMKDIIRSLHRGLTTDEAKERFDREVGNVSSSEIAEIEQSLINEGISAEEIMKFCNVHTLIFQSSLEKAVADETFPSHPVYLFRQENREIEKLVGSIRDVAGEAGPDDLASLKDILRNSLLKLRGVETHYERKEQLLFPYLEKQDFSAPSKVMWGKDNEVREMLKAALAAIDEVTGQESLQRYRDELLDPLLEEVSGMVFKEEGILFPASLERLRPGDWMEILRESDDIGYVFIERPEETEAHVKELEKALLEETVFEQNTISLPTGTIQPDELVHLLNTLPVDLTFVDRDDTVRYFSEGKDRIFRRTKSVIGRKVQNCHPPQSVDAVEQVLTSFKEGTRNSYDFWLNLQDRLIYIRYFALRDRQGVYLGTLEVTQDVTGIRQLEGEKRLVSE